MQADGSQVPDPLGTCEMQAYIYGSKIGLAEVLEHQGEKHTAQHLRSEAREFKKRFNDFFWMEKEGRWRWASMRRTGRSVRSLLMPGTA